MLERDIWKIAFKSLRKDPAYPPLARFGPTLDGHNSGPFPLHSCKFELYPAYLTPSVSSVPQILRRYSWTAWPLPPEQSLLWGRGVRLVYTGQLVSWLTPPLVGGGSRSKPVKPAGRRPEVVELRGSRRVPRM